MARARTQEADEGQDTDRDSGRGREPGHGHGPGLRTRTRCRMPGGRSRAFGVSGPAAHVARRPRPSFPRGKTAKGSDGLTAAGSGTGNRKPAPKDDRGTGLPESEGTRRARACPLQEIQGMDCGLAPTANVMPLRTDSQPHLSPFPSGLRNVLACRGPEPDMLLHCQRRVPLQALRSPGPPPSMHHKMILQLSQHSILHFFILQRSRLLSLHAPVPPGPPFLPPPVRASGSSPSLAPDPHAGSTPGDRHAGRAPLPLRLPNIVDFPWFRLPAGQKPPSLSRPPRHPHSRANSRSRASANSRAGHVSTHGPRPCRSRFNSRPPPVPTH
jgi:hypothetical protein